MLFLAGSGMDSRLWADTMVALNAHGIRTIAYDRRGHGRSSDPGTVDYDQLADDLAAVSAALDLRDLVLVAHSGAGGEAIRYIGRHGTDRLRQVVLVGATAPCPLLLPDNPEGIPSAAMDSLLAELSGDLAGWIDRNAAPFAPGVSPRLVDWLGGMMLDVSRRILVDFQQAILQADLRAEAAALRLPVTIVHGDRDASAPIDQSARRYAALIPGARLLVYEGAPHGLMLTDRDRLCRDLLAL
jgi:pimeloyl-ACP methyl ester carboxylesterase